MLAAAEIRQSSSSSSNVFLRSSLPLFIPSFISFYLYSFDHSFMFLFLRSPLPLFIPFFLSSFIPALVYSFDSVSLHLFIPSFISSLLHERAVGETKQVNCRQENTPIAVPTAECVLILQLPLNTTSRENKFVKTIMLMNCSL